MSTIVSAQQIAKYFIWKASKEGKRISNKKLQKLLYYSQAWNLVFNKKPLFKENIEAWIHGPAIKDVYFAYKKFGFGPIDVEVRDEEVQNMPEKNLLDDVWTVYGKYDADYLEELTHNEEPWQVARENVSANEASENIISLEVMKDYYTRKLAEV